MIQQRNQFRPQLELLETREVPGSLGDVLHDIGHIGDQILDGIEHLGEGIRHSFDWIRHNVISRFDNAVKGVVQDIEYQLTNTGLNSWSILNRIELAARFGGQTLVGAVLDIGLELRNTGDNYAEVRQRLRDKYGPGKVYLSSKEFTDWASPERGIGYALAAIATGGAALPAEGADLANQLSREAARIESWLIKKMGSQAPNEDTILSGLVMGAELGSVKIKWTHVDYQYRVKWPGGSYGFSVQHAAFAVIWQGDSQASGPVLRAL